MSFNDLNGPWRYGLYLVVGGHRWRSRARPCSRVV